jgi:hypothetical protein
MLYQNILYICARQSYKVLIIAVVVTVFALMRLSLPSE